MIYFKLVISSVCLVTKIFLMWWHKIREACLVLFYLVECVRNRKKINLFVSYILFCLYNILETLQCMLLIIIFYNQRACGGRSFLLFRFFPSSWAHGETIGSSLPCSEVWPCDYLPIEYEPGWFEVLLPDLHKRKSLAKDSLFPPFSPMQWPRPE